MYKYKHILTMTLVLILAPMTAPAQTSSYGVIGLDKPIAASMPDADKDEYAFAAYEYFHQHPEVRWKEENTIAAIIGEVTAIYNSSRVHYDLVMENHPGGFVVDMIVDPTNKLTLFRADIDAFPVQEQTQLAYASLNHGVMHACGHDLHNAALLSAFREYMYGRFTTGYNIRFVWQRAEENPVDQSGGHSLVFDSNVTEGVSFTVALHALAREDIPPGTFASRPGPLLANNDQFLFKMSSVVADTGGNTIDSPLIKFTVTARGGHVASPHLGSNAVDVMADLQNLLSRYSFVRPLMAEAGVPNQANVRPSTGVLLYALDDMKLVETLEMVASTIDDSYPDDVSVHMEVLSASEGLSLTDSPMVQAASVYHMMLRGIDRRFLGSLEPAALTPATYLVGDGQGEIWYSARTYLGEEGRTALELRLQKIASAIHELYPSLQLEYEFRRGYPVTVNDQNVYENTKSALEAAGFDASHQFIELGSEDMSYYQARVPGVYWGIGVWQEGSGDHHSPTFNPDAEKLPSMIDFWGIMGRKR